jgi:hypothetical protein
MRWCFPPYDFLRFLELVRFTEGGGGWRELFISGGWRMIIKSYPTTN